MNRTESRISFISIITSSHSRNDSRIYQKEAISLSKVYGNIVIICADEFENNRIDNLFFVSVLKKKATKMERLLLVPWRILLETLRQKADIVHFHDPELLIVALVLKICGKIVVYDVHENVPDQILDKMWIPTDIVKKITSKCFLFLENLVTRLLDGVITVTPYLHDRFQHINKNTVLVSNFPLNTKESKNIKWIERDLSVGYVGSWITLDRGLKEMLEAARLSNTIIELYGRLPQDKFTLQVMKQYSHNYKYHGLVSWEQANLALAQMKIGLVTEHPTHNAMNAYCIKMFEYMHNGVPVISSNIPLWKDIIDEYKCGICVNPRNPEEISAAIRFILDNPTYSEEMSKNCIRAIDEKYCWDNEEIKLLNFYKMLVQKCCYLE